MNPDPAGRWEARVHPLGRSSVDCRDDLLMLEVHSEGSVAIVTVAGGRSLAGFWHRAGQGRVVISASGDWGSVEAAVEVAADGKSLSGRALGRQVSRSASARPVVVVVEVEGRRVPDPRLPE